MPRQFTSSIQDAIKNQSLSKPIQMVVFADLSDKTAQILINYWEEVTDELKTCDLVFGCLDTIMGRRDLENFCRRYLIPYIDIGMGIETSRQPYAMFGQVQLSLPGCPCMVCNGFITEESLKKEANNYGQKTKRPQVVWPNGVLASTAIGIAVNIITGWNKAYNPAEYLSYNGNDHSIEDHLMKSCRSEQCEHYPLIESGPIRRKI